MPVAQSAAAATADLVQALGGRVSTADAVRRQHSHDESHHAAHLPDAVVSCQSTDDVVTAVRICARHRIPLVPFGAGTGLEGGVNPSAGGVSLDLTGMNRVLRVSTGDLDATVQAGVTRLQLNDRLGGQGLFFPVDPGADASLGGMAATRASGTNAVRYGTMRENVLGLSVVLADGRVIRTGGRARKSAAGYDLTRLFVGSEGTLGVITEITLRLHGIPETIAAAVCAFPDLHSAVQAVVQVIQLGIPVARAELLDEAMMDAINRFSGTGYPVAPTLFLEFHGGPRSVAEQLDQVRGIAADMGSPELPAALRREERSRLWQARHDALPAAKALRAGAVTWSTDVCVPISALPEIVAATSRALAASGLMAPLAGHVGDGNFHLAFVLDPADTAERERAAQVHDQLVRRALQAGGTCTGEHGIGSGKTAFLQAEHGPAVSVMRDIKNLLDPLAILNPGKVVPPATDPGPGRP